MSWSTITIALMTWSLSITTFKVCSSFHYQSVFIYDQHIFLNLWQIATYQTFSMKNTKAPTIANNETFWYFTFGHDYSEWKHGGLCAHEKMLDGIRNVVSCHDTLPYLPNPKQKGKKPTTKTTEKNPSSAQQNLKVPTETMKSTDVGVKLPWGKIQQSNDDGTIVS